MVAQIPVTVESDSGPDYDVSLAEQCEQRELEMSFKEALSNDKRLIWSSVGFSGTIIMEGYGLAMITYLFASLEFQKKFGESYVNEKGETAYLLPYVWQTLFPIMAQVGSIVGILIASPMHRFLGYKKAVLLMLACLAGLTALPFASTSGEILMAGFFLEGIPWGTFQVLSPGYSSEVASLQLRPILTTWNNLCWVIGQLLAAAFIKGFDEISGAWSYRLPFALQWVFIVILLIAVSFAPESPYWHLENGRVPEARAAAKKLVRKGSPERTEEKLALMRHTIHQESRADRESIEGSAWKRYTALLQGSERRRTEIACVTWLIQAMCGSCLIGWAPQFMETAGLSPSDSYSINIAIPFAGLLGTIASWWLMLKWGRRKIYFWGCLFMGIVLVAEGFSSFDQNEKTRGFVAGGILIIFTAIYDLTIGPVCYCIVSEIPSIRYRTPTLSAARGTYLLFNLINYFINPLMFSGDKWNWGPKSGYLYAAICLLGAAYTWLRIPETDGVSARELDILFQHKIKARDFSAPLALQLDGHGQGNVRVESHSSIVVDEPKKA
ncbi:General substrate transporter [Rhypophila sp. PSN 637]